MKAIKLLSARIVDLEVAIEKVENWCPKTLLNFDVSKKDIQRCKDEIIELQNAIKILNENL